MIKVAVDAMGGDCAPGEMVAGAVEATDAEPGIQVLLVGQEQAVVSKLSKHTYSKDRVQVVDATKVIATEEPPVGAIRKKKDSSIMVSLSLVKQGGADTFVSAESSGAILVDGQVIVGRNKDVERPLLAPLIPTKKSVLLLIDYGANVDTRASHLVQFAQMSSIYVGHVMGTEDPRVAIVNIDAEEEKGNALVKETSPLLKECRGVNLTGSTETREIPHSGADIVVCEALADNVVLKLYGGVRATLTSVVKGGMMPTLCSKIDAPLVESTLKETPRSFDGSQYGGTPLLGLKDLVAKTYGNLKRTEVCNSVIQCVTFKGRDTNGEI